MKLHPEEQHIVKSILEATEFSAFYQNGLRERYCVRGFTSYVAAKSEMLNLVATYSKFGRRGIVYAITKFGQVPCDDKLVALAEAYKNSQAD